MSLTEKFINWCHDESATARFERTVFQAVLSVIVTALPQYLQLYQLPEIVNMIIVPSVMAFLSIVQAEIGKNADGSWHNQLVSEEDREAEVLAEKVAAHLKKDE